MQYEPRTIDIDIDLRPECYECGIRLTDEDTFDVDGDPLCEQCAEERMDDWEMATHPAADDESGIAPRSDDN